MHYPILKLLMKLAMRLYFRRIVCDGLSVPEQGKPVLILANHTNGFLDALVVGAVSKKKPFFFTRGDAFQKKWVDKVLRSIGLLPIYRISEGRENMQHNDTTNEEARTIISEGGIVVIYAEGKSDVAKVLKPLKKGPFRLAVQMTDEVKIPPVIVPLGINYVHPVKPFTTLYLQAGKAIDISACAGLPETEKARFSLQLMRRVGDELPALAWHVVRPEDVLLADDLLALQELTSPSFAATQQLIAALNALDEDAQIKLRTVWNRYRTLQQKSGLENEDETRRLSLKDITILTICALPAIAGWAFHWLPVFLSKRIADKIVKDIDLYSSVLLSCSLLLTVLWYLITLPLAGIFMGWPVLLTALIALPSLGVFYLKIYRPALLHLRSVLKYRSAAQRSAAEAGAYWSLRNELTGFILAAQG